MSLLLCLCISSVSLSLSLSVCVRLTLPHTLSASASLSLFVSLWSALQVLSAATIVAKHTSALCNACRLASSKTSNPAAKRHFVQSAKEVANSTANLVKTIKVSLNIAPPFSLLLP